MNIYKGPSPYPTTHLEDVMNKTDSILASIQMLLNV